MSARLKVSLLSKLHFFAKIHRTFVRRLKVFARQNENLPVLSGSPPLFRKSNKEMTKRQNSSKFGRGRLKTQKSLKNTKKAPIYAPKIV